MTSTRTFASVQAGEELPKLVIPITVALVAGGAIATRDYFPGHHDPEAARALGSPHIFMNILTTNGLVERFVEGWAGPDCRLATLKIKLGAPNYPGDTLTFTGTVTDRNEAGHSVEVTLRGANSMGAHVTGTVRVKLP
ncbi:MAG: acyl dehydratase [Rhodanobacter sp.]|nr:MAG: acyl dehydratase [Rhodanobacter sp.]TAM12734.1 MAG: acyl dehydratase [Rhodanobacter sp.]TAM37556.1 MAG: acyl dehydratase [Rhodanobacter sp.]